MEGYILGEGECLFGHLGWEWVGNVVEFLKVGGVYGQEWMDVGGEGGDWKEGLR